MIVRGGGQSAGGTFLESRFAPAHHNSWRGPLGASQFPQPHLEDGSVYRQNRPTRLDEIKNRGRFRGHTIVRHGDGQAG